MKTYFRRRAIVVAFVLAIGLIASHADAGTGSNLGVYATNFSPAVVEGQVTNGGIPVSGASISTIAGHSTTTDGSGNYTIPLNAPGTYTLTAQSGPNNGTDTVEASAGTSAVLNLDIGPPPTPTPIPGLTTLGLFLLAGLFLAVILVILRRRPRFGIAAGSLVLISSVALFAAGQEASAVTGPGYNGLSYTERGTLDIPTPGGIEVNNFTGNLVIQRSLFATPGKGLLVHPYLTYNSDHRLISSPFGFGWNFSYSIRYTKDSSGNVFIVWGDGRTDAFTTIGGGAFSSPPGLYMVLTEPVAGELLLRTKGGIEFHFTDSGHRKLTSIQDPNGNTLTLTYDASVRLTTITDASGRTHTLAYDANGRLSQLTETALGRSYLLAYDASGRLTGLTDPLANAETFAYDAEDLLTSVTDKRGNVATVTYITPAWDADTRLPSNVAKGGSTTGLAFNNAIDTTTATDSLSNDWEYAYDASGRVTSVTDPALEAVAYTWDGNRNLTGLTDRNGNTTTMTYDANGNVLTTIDALSNTETLTYDATFNRMLTYKDRNDSTWTNTYDANGNRTQSQDPLTNSSSWTYDTAGQVTTATDANTNTTSFTYDANGNVATITDPLSNLTQFAYDAASRLTQVPDANSDVTAYAYDALNRLTIVTDPLANTDSRAYDANGNLTSYTDRNSNVTGYAYDSLNRLTVVTDALSNADGRAYDANGNLTSYTDRNSNVTAYAYDSLNRLTVVTDALSNADGRTYDANGNVTAYTDPNGNVWGTTFDALNRVTVRTNPLSNAWQLTYDANGNLVSQIDAMLQLATFTYDVNNRLIGQSFADGTQSGFLYDAVGNVSNASNDVSGYTYVYDSLNRLSQTTYFVVSKSISRTYDPAGRLLTETGAEGSIVTYGYDAAGRLSSLGDASGTTTYTRDPMGNVLTDARANGVTSTFTYDVRGLKSSISHEGSGGVLQSFAYVRDANGLVSQTTRETGEVVAYTRDVVGRVTAETGGLPFTGGCCFSAFSSTYTYDALGRMTALTTDDQFGPYTFSFGFDAAGRPITESDNGNPPRIFENDANGSRTGLRYGSGGGSPEVQWTYNAKNQPTTLIVGGETETYIYDALDQLIQYENSSAGYGRRLYDPWGLLVSEDNDNDGVFETSYSNAPLPGTQLLATSESGTL